MENCSSDSVKSPGPLPATSSTVTADGRACSPVSVHTSPLSMTAPLTCTAAKAVPPADGTAQRVRFTIPERAVTRSAYSPPRGSWNQ
jgi:hypothetical protein